MTIYISHATSFDFDTELYQPLKNVRLPYTIILPHEESSAQYSTKELFQSKKCDLVIAEVSYPSTGQGIELGWANLLKIPVVCLYKQGIKPSGAIKVVTDQMLEYTDSADLIGKIKSIIAVRS